ncbi:hypothetical protein [Haloferula sargassicola]|uniref:hypothetical protein n=1 Tax=Haloferula sargassicola TaxID=490096 RepID=UPI0033653FD0
MIRWPASLPLRWLSLAGLVVLTLALYHLRFVPIAHRVNGDGGFSRQLDGWEVLGPPPDRSGSGKNRVIRYFRTGPRRPNSAVVCWLGPVNDLRFLRVRSEVRWAEVVPGGAYWAKPRLALVTRSADGKLGYPRDHASFLATGTKPWHVEESVYELVPELPEVGLAFQMLARRGSFEIRSIEITALRQRSWVPAATALLLAGWFTWVLTWLHGARHPASLARRSATAVLLVAAAWYLILPGARMQFRPLIGTFVTGATPALPDPPPVAAQPASRGKPTPPSRPTDQPSATPPPALEPGPAASPPAEIRRVPRVTRFLRMADLKFRFVHLLAFLGLSLAAFITAAGLRPLPLLAALALLSEVVSDWHDRAADLGDLLDLAWDLLGILLAMLVFRAVKRGLARWRSPPPLAGR